MHEIKVSVIEFGDRPHYQMQYRDPMTGKKKTKTTGIERSGRKRDRDAAERVAAKWEEDLRQGRYQPPSKTGWDDFRQRYENEVLPGQALTTAAKVGTVFDAVERIISPTLLRDLTADRLSYFQAELRSGGRAETTIAGMLAHLRAPLAWAVTVGLLPAVPKMQKPKRAKAQKMMKGRPITGEEFDRMLAKVEDVAGKTRAEAWRRYLRGLWLSGLRLEESLELFWDRDDRLCVVNLDRRRPMLQIPAALEKGNQDRLLPMAPEFAEFLQAIPEADRTGRVFKLAAAGGGRMSKGHVSMMVSDFGQAAGIKVNTDAAGKVKYASAHDLRRSFGERWSSRVMPQVLMELMRHESIETTMRFYVGRNAQKTADVLWAAHAAASGNTSGNSTAPEAAFSREN